jgi:hypothetical protein
MRGNCQHDLDLHVSLERRHHSKPTCLQHYSRDRRLLRGESEEQLPTRATAEGQPQLLQARQG